MKIIATFFYGVNPEFHPKKQLYPKDLLVLQSIKKHTTMIKKILANVAVAALLSWGSTTQAQDITFPKPSPASTIKQGFATSFVEINYSRPSKNGREIFGKLVPYGELWRTGANAATTIEFGQAVSVAGVQVSKGTYGLLTIPGENEWTVILTKDLNVTSARAYKPENDIVKVKLPVNKLTESARVETFTIDIQNLKDNSFTLSIAWDLTRIAIPVTANYETELVAQIEKAMATDTRPYYTAAYYYFNNNKDMAKALEWIQKADEITPDRYWVQTLKAKIEFANKKYNEALETAEKAKKNASNAGNNAYAAEMDELMSQIKAQPDYKAPKGKKK